MHANIQHAKVLPVFVHLDGEATGVSQATGVSHAMACLLL
jgi:hypothetical protein